MKNNDYLLNHFVFPRKIDTKTSPYNRESSYKPSSNETEDDRENCSFVLLFLRGLKEVNGTLPKLIPPKNRAQLDRIFNRWRQYQKWPSINAEQLKEATDNFRVPGDYLPMICENKNALLVFRVPLSKDEAMTGGGSETILVNATQLLLSAEVFLNDKECPVRQLPDGPTFAVPQEKVSVFIIEKTTNLTIKQKIPSIRLLRLSKFQNNKLPLVSSPKYTLKATLLSAKNLQNSNFFFEKV